MEFPPFASLGHLRILVVPAGNTKKHAFNKWATLIRSFETIRLGDIPPDGRDDHARFMPSPLSTGHLHLSFPSHPPPSWHSPLALLRPSEFPLGIIGIAECSASSSLSSILAEFTATVANLFPPGSPFPLAHKCYVFEDNDGTGTLNLGDSLPGMVVIPSVMGNKDLYVGTLIAELCSSIIGEFSNLARSVESPVGIEALNTDLFPTLTIFSEQRHESSTPSRHSASSTSVPGGATQTEVASRSSMPVIKRVSTVDVGRPVIPSRNASLAVTATSKAAKRQSGISVPPTGRLFKLLGDFFLLAGRSSDAGVWYGESLSLLSKSPQDTVWHASALEGLCTVQVLEAWTAGYGIHTSQPNEAQEPWLDISEKLAQATALYARAPPGTSTPDLDSSLIALLLTTCVCRHTALLFSIWASKGWGPLAFTTLIRSGLPPSFSPAPPTESRRIRMSVITGISRAQIASILVQAHGPFLLHLEPHDRICLLQHMAAIYSCLGFRRKEVYILRELLATVMDMLVCGRDEANRNTRERGTGLATLGGGMGLGDTGSVGVRVSESTDGNESIIRMVKYICEVYGVDLEAVKFAGPDAQDEVEVGTDVESIKRYKVQYGWDELQLGVVREAVAIAEALPDHSTVAQFDLSALRTLHTIINPSDQVYLYANSAKALVTARRRGDDRRVEYWSGNPVVSIEISPLPFVRLPTEHHARDLLPSSEDVNIVVGKRDPFIYNPRLSSKSKAQAIVVQNETIEFIITFQNPFAFDLELQNVSLSTSGVPLQSQSLAATIPANSFHVTRIVGTALQPGTLVIRGCIVQAHGGKPREFVLPLATEAEDIAREKRRSTWSSETHRIKESGLDARPWVRDKRLSISKAKTARMKTHPDVLFLECNVVAQQPLMRIRRTSLTHGAVMMYDGETSTIRLTVENVSTIPIEFIKVTCIDSTMAPAQQALAEGEMSVFDTYETEYELLRRPVFRWDADGEPKAVGPGNKVVLTITCAGKVGCTSGTIQISYSHISREVLSSLDIFYTRQILYPVLVTVYNTLECHNMDVLPFTAVPPTQESRDTPGFATAERESWRHTLEALSDEEGMWSLFTVDVRNTYGMPFEVTFERHQDDTPAGTISRLVAPGSTSRIILPIRRFLLPESQTSVSIPTLSDRQFVVSKSKLTSKEEKHQRELFWYREALFQCVKARWRELDGRRFGLLSLRQQRFTAPMLEVLRPDRARLRLALVDYDEATPTGTILPSKGGRTITRPNNFVYLRITITNSNPDPLILTLSLTLSPSEHVLYDGVLSDIPVSRLESGENREIEFGLCFVSEGKFILHAEAFPVDHNMEEDARAGEGELRVSVCTEA